MSWFGPRRQRPIVAVVFLLALGFAVGGLNKPVEVRHSAPFGFSQTLDRDRLIAVRGGYVLSNYDDFNRVDLDVRAYSRQERYDLIVHVRPAGTDAPDADVRTVPLSVSGTEVWHNKSTFENDFVTVRFPPIADSAGQRFYVWVEAGPRNRDAIWTLWSVKTYSTTSGYTVLRAWFDAPPEPLGQGPGRVALIVLMVGTVLAAAWLVAALVGLALGSAERRRAADHGASMTPGDA
jgi:hypothetical protein